MSLMPMLLPEHLFVGNYLDVDGLERLLILSILGRELFFLLELGLGFGWVTYVV